MAEQMISSDDKDAIKARADEIRAEEAAAAAAECVEKFAPLLELLASPEFQMVRAQATELAPAFVTYPRVYNALESLPRQMDLVSMTVPATARETPQP